MCDRRGCHVEIHGHEIHGGERHASVQKRIHGLHSLHCKAFRVGRKRQADDQIVTGIVFSFVFGFFVGDEFCHGLRSPGCGFAVAVEILVFDVEVERGDVIAVDHLLVCVGKGIDVGTCAGKFGAVLPAEADGYRAIGFVGLRDTAVEIERGSRFVERVVAAPAGLAAVAGGDETEGHIPVDVAHFGFKLV